MYGPYMNSNLNRQMKKKMCKTTQKSEQLNLMIEVKWHNRTCFKIIQGSGGLSGEMRLDLSDCIFVTAETGVKTTIVFN